MAEKELKLTITAEDKASDTIKNVAGETAKLDDNVKKSSFSFQDFGKNLTSLGKDLSLKLTAPIVGVSAALVKMESDFGQFQSIQRSLQDRFNELGLTTEEFTKKVNAAAKGTLSDFRIMSDASLALSLIGKEAIGENGENFEKMAVIAKKAARTTGQSVEFMMESIIKGIGRNSTMWLDNTGIVISADDTYRELAKTLGKSTEELTIQEKKVGLMNAYFARSDEVLKNVAVTSGGVGTAFERVNVQLSNLYYKIAAQFEPIMVKLLQTILPIVEEYGPKLVALIGSVVNWFSGLDKNIQLAILGFIAFMAILGPVLLILGSVISVLTSLWTIITTVITIVGSLMAILGAPVLAVIAAVIAVIVLLKTIWETNFLGIQDITKTVIDWFNAVWPPFWEGLKAVVSSVWKGIVGAIESATDAIYKSVTGMIDIINSAIGKVNELLGKQQSLDNAFKNSGANWVLPSMKKNVQGQHGLVVPGSFNQPVPIIAHGGERIIPKTGTDVNSQGGGSSTININISGDVNSMDMVNNIAQAVKSALSRDNELAMLGVGV